MKYAVLTAIILSTMLVASCDQGIDVLNVAPEVTAIGPVFVGDDGQVSIFFWVRDHEEDPVDLDVELVRGGDGEAITVTGHGVVGLTTSREPTGKFHRLLWDPTDVAEGDTIRLRITPTDSNGAPGLPFETSDFTLTDGLPNP